LGSRSPRLPGALTHKGGKVVVVVYVVVTTVVLVAGANENWPMVAYGSVSSVCTDVARASVPRPAGGEAMLWRRVEGREEACTSFANVSRRSVGGIEAVARSIAAERPGPADVMS
jgi:hypothetical protein